ncbi:PepSY domain-containing protein [Luteolibacter yonseiensis]|uniref:PepSY domain-containing protein n=1 Tax=Luteolibacter yonseiensis TaxID=1144680 RepID=A0A934VBA4_9BACT|nr:PepSY-associated TM helix domain-containing protein [Luteolibacter yonseiensis]MBK1815945.1 PepSY domain-containing protein [Luteolibacter yonseiensis]
MKLVRKTIFWLHLGIGLLAGVLVLMMSVTGVLMAFERQIVEKADGFHITATGNPLGPEAHLDGLRTAKQPPSSLGFERDATRPVVYQFGKEKAVFSDPYTGKSLGNGNTAVRGFFKFILSWHRWLGREGASQATGKAIIGIGNLMFLFLLVTGVFLWFPKRWTRSGVKAITLLQKRLKGRARDWNWHNVFGFWAAIPLLVIVISGTVISQPWATTLVFHLAGETPPVQGERKKPAPFTLPESLAGLDAAFATVKSSNPDWQSIQLQLPFAKTATFIVADSHRGRPDLRRTITVDLATSGIVKSEGFDDLGPGRQTRTWIRWLHTGEAGGLPGQTIAGLAATASAVLVWTGFALSFRRFFKKRRAAA